MPDDKTQAATTTEVTADAGSSSISPMIIIPPVMIAIVMSFLLAVVYGVTKGPIAEAKRKDERDKLTQVMPEFDEVANDPLDTKKSLSEEPEGKPGNIVLYTGIQGEEVSGYGMKSAVGTGYSGYFSVVFGVSPDGTVNKVKVLESMETPGLGSKAAEPDFISQLEGKKLDDFKFSVTKDGGDVDAVTGATITSRAVCEAVEQGLQQFAETDLDAEPAEPQQNEGGE